MKRRYLILVVGWSLPLSAQAARELHPFDELDSTLAPEAVHNYIVRLDAAGSSNLVARQEGVDIVVEVRDPRGSLIATFDSPNGRNGDEPVEIFAQQSGTYSVRVRPFDTSEPTGRYHLRVIAIRSASATLALLHQRQLARDSATSWLRQRSSPIASPAAIATVASLPSFDSLAARASIIGLGEATHGSREFGDLRVAMVQRLISRNGFRVVGIEGSTSRYRAIERYVSGEAAGYARGAGPADAGWIGVRSQRALIEWVRRWNVEHPGDRVRLVGLDPQDNQPARDTLQSFVKTAYGADALARLMPMFRELAAADSQTAVFADSNVDSTARQLIGQVVATLSLDRGLLVKRYGQRAFETALDAARELAQFADFNSGGRSTISHSRDWYMATNLLEAIDRTGSSARAVFWGHNAHVAHPPSQSAASRTSGAWLRDGIGCGYAAIASAFGEGAFIAQMPNDLTDRVVASTLPASPPESIDAVLAAIRSGTSITSWSCPNRRDAAPNWLRSAQPMHWVGALFAPGTPPTDAYRRFDLLNDFDGIVFTPTVTAEDIPPNLPLIPGRKRN